MDSKIFTWLEWIAVGLNLIFVVLLIRQKKVAWWFGIVGSAISILLFIQAKLYAEAILYSFYVLMGFYGLRMWQSASGVLPISTFSLVKHLKFVSIGVMLSIGLGVFFASQTDAQKPYADAFSTIFSFYATYLEAKKILSAWLFWLVLNAFSVWLYAVRGLEIYASLMVLYAILSIVGYAQWHKSYRLATR